MAFYSIRSSQHGVFYHLLMSLCVVQQIFCDEYYASPESFTPWHCCYKWDLLHFTTASLVLAAQIVLIQGQLTHWGQPQHWPGLAPVHYCAQRNPEPSKRGLQSVGTAGRSRGVLAAHFKAVVLTACSQRVS